MTSPPPPLKRALDGHITTPTMTTIHKRARTEQALSTDEPSGSGDAACAAVGAAEAQSFRQYMEDRHVAVGDLSSVNLRGGEQARGKLRG
eukprot:152210-Prymnesium_polylepis.1